MGGTLLNLSKGIRGLAFLAALSAWPAFSQNPLVCIPGGVQVPVASEGLTEALGDILLSCTHGTPGAVVTGNLTVFLSVNITNKIASNNITDAMVTVDTGSGPVVAPVVGELTAPNRVVFTGLTFTVPASGNVSVKISNLRGNANQLGLSPKQAITASLSMTIAIAEQGLAAIGITERALLANVVSGTVQCSGSPLPASITVSNLLAANTRVSSVRVTEGFGNALRQKDPLSDTGTRIMLNYSGFPNGARLFVPDAIAGSTAIEQTSAGDLGTPQSGGQYAASTDGSLLLVRVLSPAADGSGGTLAYTYPGAGIATLDGASEVPLSAGAGIAVYEVVDSNRLVRESAQIPTFLGLSAAAIQGNVLANVDLSLAPVSTVGVASAGPVPRFVAVAPLSDCDAMADCNAAYFPHLEVGGPALDYAAPAGAFLQTKYEILYNTGSGEMPWTATVTIPDGPRWLTVSPSSGFTAQTLRVDAHPELVPPGTYTGTVTIDAGPIAGSRTLPVTFTVGDAFPAVTSVQNSATLQPGPLVAGSLATLVGHNFGSSSVATFDGQPAQRLAASTGRMILQVPEKLAGKTTSQVLVISDGVPGAPAAVSLAPVAPGIFGVLNQDNSLNGAAHPASVGSVLQIFATGLISAGSGAVSARIGGREIANLYYAGPAPGVPGMQQVNVSVPADQPAMTTNVQLCAVSGSQPVCSPPVSLVIAK
jgi:uncharacterized protein (TIGR03437 family)